MGGGRSEGVGKKGGGLRQEARGSRCGVPRRPWRAFALLSPPLAGALPPPSAPRLAFPRGGGSEGWGGSSAFPPPSSPLAPVVTRSPRRPRWRPGRVASRDARLGGGSPWRLPGRVLACPGGPRSLGSRGAPRRPPPPAARPGWLSAPSGGVRPPRARLPALRASLFCPTPQTFYPPSFRPPFRPRVRSGSGFPSPSPPPPRTATPTPLPARAPLPAAAPLPRGGAWAAGAGEGTVRVGRCHGEGVLGSEGGAGAGRPRRPWMGGEEGSCGGRGGGGEARGVGRRRSVGAVSPVGASVTGRQRRGSGLPFVGPAAAPGGVGVEVVGGVAGAPSSPAHLARLHPVQVPSASRRGGLKTLGGSPVRLGSGAVGPVGSRGGWSSRVSSRLRCPPPAAPQAGVPPRLRPRHGPPRLPGGGLPGGCRVVRERVRARAPRVPWVCVGGGDRREPPGRLWGLFRARPARPRGWGGLPDLPCRSNPSDLLESGLCCLLLAGRRHPSGMCCARLGGRPFSGLALPAITKTRTTLSGGSLGSCVDEERS